VNFIDPLAEEVLSFDCIPWIDDLTTVLVVERELRPLTPEELHTHRVEVRATMLKELRSWVANDTGKPVKVSDYVRKTGLKPLPARWVIEWKRKEGKLVIKARLCLKGFAEANQHSLQTSAPTATRLGHRIIVLACTLHRWPLWSLDVSTAFLQGWTFDELRESGYERQPCAFIPPSNTMELLGEISENFRAVAKLGIQHCIELSKAAYGLKDAPLLWNLRFAKFLINIGFVRSPHDSCVYCWYNNGKLGCMLSLHVDDTLCTGELPSLTRLHSLMEEALERSRLNGTASGTLA
jgi:hypothetical protein